MMHKPSNRLAALRTVDCRAAPAGGAPLGGRGCTLLLVLVTSFAALPTLAQATPVDLPSGRTVSEIEFLSDVDEGGPVLRARYHAPDLSAAADMDQVFEDMGYLCESNALQMRDTLDEKPNRIIVSLSSQPIEFGEVNPDVTQFFEAYAIESGRCIWELF